MQTWPPPCIVNDMVCVMMDTGNPPLIVQGLGGRQGIVELDGSGLNRETKKQVWTGNEAGSVAVVPT